MDDGILIAGFLSSSTLISFFKAAFGLGIVIFVHELGHFLVAKACGVKCEKFYVGFDAPIKIAGISLPRTLFKRQWGETEYGIGIIPLGGYVKMLGQDDNPANAANEAERIRVSGDQLDPRSYPAKSVPQRMAIISAGVIFNLIFGIIFAACAYKMGAKYMPTVIGSAGVGDPAWFAGIQPGDRIVSLSADQADDDRLRFTNDLKFKMLSLNKEEQVDMRLKDLDGNVRQVTIQPNSGYSKQVGTPTIGVRMAHAPVIFAVIHDSIAERAGLKPGDRIHAITVDGVRTEINPQGFGIDLQQVLARSQNKPITLSVSRTDKETKANSQHDVTLGIDSTERFGIELAMGPIECIQQGSAADLAGLQVGDILEEIDGQPIGDPLTLPVRMLEYIDRDTQFTVKRGDTTTQMTIRPPPPTALPTVGRRDGPIGIDSLGIGYVMYPEVRGVVSGSPADEAGIQVGDVLSQVQMVIPDTPIPPEDRWPVMQGYQKVRHARQNKRLLGMLDLDKAVQIDRDNNNWPFVVHTVQDFGIQFEIDLTYLREGQELQVRLVPAKSATTVDTSRGFGLQTYEETRTAASWGEALALGKRETFESMSQVVFVLRKISSNYKNLGGPITIVAAATSEASEGLPRLLLFLTLLSANLAVLNFLPIPVLDGGHMLFLAYEGIVGKPVNERIQMSLTLIGFSLLMCLMIFVFGLDISRLLG